VSLSSILAGRALVLIRGSRCLGETGLYPRLRLTGALHPSLPWFGWSVGERKLLGLGNIGSSSGMWVAVANTAVYA
jgi:hypothetical protein